MNDEVLELYIRQHIEASTGTEIIFFVAWGRTHPGRIGFFQESSDYPGSVYAFRTEPFGTGFRQMPH